MYIETNNRRICVEWRMCGRSGGRDRNTGTTHADGGEEGEDEESCEEMDKEEEEEGEEAAGLEEEEAAVPKEKDVAAMTSEISETAGRGL